VCLVAERVRGGAGEKLMARPAWTRVCGTELEEMQLSPQLMSVLLRLLYFIAYGLVVLTNFVGGSFLK